MSSKQTAKAAYEYEQDMHSDFQEFFMKRSAVCRMCGHLSDFKNKNFAHDLSNMCSIDEDHLLLDKHFDSIDSTFDSPLRERGGSNASSETAIPLHIFYDPHVAALRVFISILLHSWRKRRQEIKELKENAEYLKGVSMHARSQIHLFNKLFRSEQRRNNKLLCQLKESVESVSNAKNSCDTLATSVISLKADKALMDQELRVKMKDYEALNAIFIRTKSDLYQALVEQRILESNLTKEKRNGLKIEEQKNKLINELGLLREESNAVQQKYHADIEKKDKELSLAIDTIRSLEKAMKALQEKAESFDKFNKSEALLHREIDELQQQVAQLEAAIKESLDQRLRGFWSGMLNCQRCALRGLQRAAQYLMPATPPVQRAL